MAVLSGETIKNSIARELGQIFPNIAVYKEEQTTPYDFPNFFVLQLSMNSKEDRKDHYFQTFLYEVRYRHIADVELEPRIERYLDDVGLSLITNLVRVSIDDRPYRVLQSNYDKVDKVGHFTFQVRVQVEKEKDEKVKMLVLKQNLSIPNNLYTVPITEIDIPHTHLFLSRFTHNELSYYTQRELSQYA